MSATITICINILLVFSYLQNFSYQHGEEPLIIYCIVTIIATAECPAGCDCLVHSAFVCGSALPFLHYFNHARVLLMRSSSLILFSLLHLSQLDLLDVEIVKGKLSNFLFWFICFLLN